MLPQCVRRLPVSNMRATEHRIENIVPWLLLLVQGGLIAGCAADGFQKPADGGFANHSAGSDCFYARDVGSWRVLDRSSLIVYAPSKSHAFRVQMAPGASDLRWTDSLAFISRSNRICGHAGDRIVMPTGSIKRSYSVIDVRRLDQVALEGLLGGYGEAGQPGSPEPGKSPGAVIERELSQIAMDSEKEPAVPGDEAPSENRHDKDRK